MAPVALALIVTSAAAGAVGCAAPESEGSDTSSALIHGDLAKDGELRSVLQLGDDTEGFCTAAKVGDRHILTAAHCILKEPAERGECATGEGDVPSACERNHYWQDGGTLRLRVRSEDSERWVPRKVKGIYVPRQVLDACRSSACFWDIPGHVGTADIAIVEVDETIPDAITARVELEAIPPGMGITVLGYGCVRSSSRWIGDDKLRSRDSASVDLADYPNRVFADGRTYDRAGLQSSYFFSPSRGTDRSAPGLCSGDSGGPLLLPSGDVGGVNAYYLPAPTGETQSLNMFTRLDPGAANGVTRWLRSRLPATSFVGR